MSADLEEQVRAWIADEVDAADREELTSLLDRGDTAALAERFAGTLTFGTAGLRGPLRAGPNGMNRAVVRRAAAGLAVWLRDKGRAGTVVVGYDARHRSADFARDSAALFAAAGFDAVLLPRLLPTPVLAFAVQHLPAVAGVMVTASHNPPQDNGYKVYDEDGAQIIPPADAEIEAAIRAVGSVRAVRLDESRVRVADESLVDDYVSAVAALAPSPQPELHLVHTALHGVGTEVVRRVFTAAGFRRIESVPQQELPDADFPTVGFPNPEEPGAIDLAIQLAAERGAGLVVANDPDADRCAVAVPTETGWRMLRGYEVGVLLADALLSRDVRGTYATTIVSSSMLRALAERHGVGYAETLTGFKWISRAAPDLVYGYEEALGYAVAPGLVRDKDGISAGLLITARAAELLASGSSLLQRLEELADEYGRYLTDQVSVRFGGTSEIGALMRRLRQNPPSSLLGEEVTVADLLPDADVLRLSVSGGRVVVRPSGTEPKLKAYLEVVSNGPAAEAAETLARLRGEVEALLGVSPSTSS
jgi:phosphomannomutase